MVAPRGSIGRFLLWLGLAAGSGNAWAQTTETPQVTEANSAEVWVIAHPDVPTSTLTERELRTILLGNKRFWSGGVAIHLVIDGRAESPARTAWIEELTSMTEVQYSQYWIGMVFRGRATTAPHVVPDATTATALVAALPGAISIVDRKPTSDGVRILGTLDELLESS